MITVICQLSYQGICDPSRKWSPLPFRVSLLLPQHSENTLDSDDSFIYLYFNEHIGCFCRRGLPGEFPAMLGRLDDFLCWGSHCHSTEEKVEYVGSLFFLPVYVYRQSNLLYYSPAETIMGVHFAQSPAKKQFHYPVLSPK